MIVKFIFITLIHDSFSWNERRRVEWRSRPYFGGPVDGPCNGPPPGTWDIYQAKPQPFVKTTFYHVVPHTEEVRYRDLLIKYLTGLGQSRDP